jgi:hypothetical protein
MLCRREVVAEAAEIAAAQLQHCPSHVLNIALVRRHSILREHDMCLPAVGRSELLGQLTFNGG